MSFQTLLFPDATGRRGCEAAAAPEFFGALNLDRIVAAITAGREEYDLRPWFYRPLDAVDAIAFRQEIFRDLEDPGLFDAIKAFAQGMRAVRRGLAQAEKLRHPRQKERLFLDAVRAYCEGVGRLVRSLSAAPLRSRGLAAFRDYAREYAAAPGFASLSAQTAELIAEISAVAYSILVQGPRVEVRCYDGEPDYRAAVLATFERFQQGGVAGYRFEFGDASEVNHVEGQILDRVALLYRDTFHKLARYCAENREFQDAAIATFDREIQFYIAYLDHIARFRQAGLNFCYPRMTQAREEIFDCQGFDLALAGALAGAGRIPVCNDFHLNGAERIIVVSGPNQGGKTTFARTFGQLHYLASLGCPVPGTRAQLTLFDRIFTHFEKGENAANLRGKLQDDLVRVRGILAAATPRSIIVMNEIFASTALRDAIALSRRIAARIIGLDAYCVWVTFIDELATLGDKTVSMVSTVAPHNPALRTYKILRQQPDGLAYALSLAEKYRLTFDMIKGRVGR